MAREYMTYKPLMEFEVPLPFPPECTNIGTNDCEFGEFLKDYESEMVEKNIKYIYMYIRFN